MARTTGKEELIDLRESTGMNRREFCDYFGIPYRTVQDWELGNRRMPDYLLRLMAYKIKAEKLDKVKK
ncbi:MAG: transcriptional regulator [Clostridium sp.]|nr:transcriptional regulator [Clostridium sp.]MCM1172147.1 transcriptional regulator [Clostridium sp.]MCM1207715.1 transcriptional regulator [Ruminococcus sp.]MCM1288463.1 transcriptional regulator [Clostridium sp.]